jgi:predicted AAA+ superfamily ATPase
VLLLTGARQTGKSSLLKRLFPESQYITFDYIREVEVAKESPQQFLRKFKGRIILDEIQYVPELFRELKIQVDNDRDAYGKWIITGSQRFELMEQVSESLAGRIAVINLETLSAMELRECGVERVEDLLWRGGYPELWSNPHLESEDFFENYIRTYIERDLKQIVEVKNLNDFRRFIRVLATRVGQLINYRDIAKDVGITDVTVKRWLHALEMGGLVTLLPPFFANIGKRLVKAPKLYFNDHGLACYLLGIDDAETWAAHTHRGNLWENFVLMELVKNNHLAPGRELFFYRDQNGVEVDFIIEQGNRISLLEAKAGENIDNRKLNFNKIVPLFQDKYQIECAVAHTPLGATVVKLKNYKAYNPLKVNYVAFE